MWGWGEKRSTDKAEREENAFKLIVVDMGDEGKMQTLQKYWNLGGN